MENRRIEYRSVPDFPKYIVSNLGSVISMDYNHTGESREISQGTQSTGYKFVVLCNNGVKKHFLVHRLVAESFIPNPNNYSQVNHKDENKANNSVENLEWCDCLYNVNYGNGINKRSCSLSITKSKRVAKCNSNMEIIEEFNSVLEAKALTGINNSKIGECCNGKRRSAGGYKWKWL